MPVFGQLLGLVSHILEMAPTTTAHRAECAHRDAALRGSGTDDCQCAMRSTVYLDRSGAHGEKLQ